MVQRLETPRANATSARRFVDNASVIVLQRKLKMPKVAEGAEAGAVRKYAISAERGGTVKMDAGRRIQTRHLIG